ncbi:MAG: hypothetical protein BGO21_01955 [Dyadobacter sp. 50-39]|nr:MAG: hypothetical protein BGO21_01955 [Dyadobacter sp. 50-39]
MLMTNPYFSGFEHSAAQIRRFLQTHKTFTLLLSGGSIVHHETDDAVRFRTWLLTHQIEDVRESFTKNYSAYNLMSA